MGVSPEVDSGFTRSPALPGRVVTITGWRRRRVATHRHETGVARTTLVRATLLIRSGYS